MTDEQNLLPVDETNPYIAESYVETLEAPKPVTVKKQKFVVPSVEQPSALSVELSGLVENHKELLEQLTVHGALVGNPNQPHTLNAIKVIAMRYGLDYRILLNLIIRLNNQ